MISTPVRLFASLPLLYVLSSPAAAETLSGRVVDPDGRVVPGATVILIGKTGSLTTTTTDGRGAFRLAAPDATGLEVRVAWPGFRAALPDIDATQPRALGDIQLVVSEVAESVVVSAAQVEIPLSQATSTVTVLTGAELDARQIHSVADALRSVPGMSVSAAGGPGAVTGVFPRGGESNFTLVFIDDVPVNAFGGEFNFAHLSTVNVERIEIVRGPQSALFGSNAIGAVVRVVTRKGGAPVLSGSFEAGGYGTARATGATSGSAGRFEWGASGERFTSDGHNGLATSAGLLVENDDYTRTSGGLTAGWRDGRIALRGQFQHAEDERGTPGPFGTNPVGAYTEIDTVSRGLNGETVAGLSATLPITGRARAVVQTGYHRLESDFASPFGPSESSSRRWSGRAQVDAPMSQMVELSAGAELQRERASSTFITDASGSPHPVERTIAAYFAEGRWSAASRFVGIVGVRLDDIRREAFGDLPEDDVVSVNPRAAVAWALNPGGAHVTRLRASAATGIRPPGAFDIAFTDNPSLKPERSTSAETAIETTFARGLAAIEAVAFFNHYDDLIVAVGSFQGSSRYMTDNISNARARGGELAVTAGRRIGSGRAVHLRGRLAYTFLDTRILAVDRDDAAPPPFTVGDALLRRPRHQLSLDASATVAGLTAFIASNARSHMLDVEPSLGTFGGLHDASGFNAWNIGASWRMRIGEVYGRVENLFDETYEEALGFPALGRRATIGLRVAASR